MAKKMTFISLPGSNWNGYADHRDKGVEYMIHAARQYAAYCREQAELVENAKDEDFLVFTANGIHVKRNRKVLQPGRLAP